nr:nifU-like protein 1, chloroplastic [Ipomoea batatas]
MAMSFLVATGSTRISWTKYYCSKLRSVSHREPSSILLPKAAQSVWCQKLKVCYKVRATAAGSPGLYSSEQFDLTPENVDKVLEDVRPYLIADGPSKERNLNISTRAYFGIEPSLSLGEDLSPACLCHTNGGLLNFSKPQGQGEDWKGIVKKEQEKP